MSHKQVIFMTALFLFGEEGEAGGGGGAAEEGVTGHI